MILKGPDAEEPIRLSRKQMDQIETLAHALGISVELAFGLSVANFRQQMIAEGVLLPGEDMRRSPHPLPHGDAETTKGKTT